MQLSEALRKTANMLDMVAQVGRWRQEDHEFKARLSYNSSSRPACPKGEPVLKENTPKQNDNLISTVGGKKRMCLIKGG